MRVVRRKFLVHPIKIKNGVDHIKLNLSGGIMGPPWDLHKHSFLLEDELEAAFDICKLREFRVMAHADNSVAIGDRVHCRFTQMAGRLLPRFEKP